MFPEPKILPWLARKSGVSLPAARGMWRDIARETAAEYGDQSDGEIAKRQICELRRRLEDAGARAQQEIPEFEAQLEWMFPYPLFKTLAECQARIALQGWLMWAKATQTFSQWSWRWAPAGR